MSPTPSPATPSVPPPDPVGFPSVTRLSDGPAGVDDGAVRFFPHLPGPEDRVVLLLHGLGSDEDDLLSLAPQLPRDVVYASLRGVHACGQGYGWLQPPPLDPSAPGMLEESAHAVETWIDARLSARPVGAIGFSQGGILALQLLRRDLAALDWAVNLSGEPYPTTMPTDDALAARRPPVLWGHGGRDPLYDDAQETGIRAWLRAHTDLVEVRSPQLGHGIDALVLEAVVGFVHDRV
jgi:phospholipase/carboxylesterase